jgi:hypothetical protein
MLPLLVHFVSSYVRLDAAWFIPGVIRITVFIPVSRVKVDLGGILVNRCIGVLAVISSVIRVFLRIIRLFR